MARNEPAVDRDARRPGEERGGRQNTRNKPQRAARQRGDRPPQNKREAVRPDSVSYGAEPHPASRPRKPERTRDNDRGPAPVGLGDHVPAFLKKAVRAVR